MKGLELVLPDLQPSVLAISPDSGWAAIGGAAGNGSHPGPSLRLCDLVRNRERSIQQGEASYVSSVAFSRDGRVLAAGNIDRNTRLYEVMTGREMLTLTGHGRSVSALAFAPGGRVLATADGGPESCYWEGRPEQTIRFWDVATGKELARLGGHDSDVTSIAFTMDGKRFVTGLQNGTALIWETPAAVRQLVSPVGRKLGPRELAALWNDLSGNDARVAYEALQILAASPDQSVPFLTKSLRPAVKLDVAKVRQWIAELGDEDFKKRETASTELTRLGEDIEQELRKGLVDNSSAEAVQRINSILKDLGKSLPPPRRQELRGVWVLELAGTPMAIEVLAGLAKGDPDARLTREAKAAIDRK